MKTNRRVMITGAAGGMGALAVARFLENGDRVLATDTSEVGLERLRASHEGASLETLKADITSADDRAALAARAQAAFGGLDVLVNVAGFFPIQRFAEMSDDDWTKIININLNGTALVIKALLPMLRAGGWGRIINFGSASIYSGVVGQAHYVAAKAGIVGLTRSIARELGADGITVNIVAPGLTVTPSVRKTFPSDALAAMVQRRAIKREEEGADLIGTVMYLASPDADFVTGQSIVVDGGNVML